MSDSTTSPNGHPERAAKFMSDEARSRWHDETLWLVRKKRDAAWAELPEWEALRERAAAIKDEALSTLADQLERFEAAAVAAGAQVHWAGDAAEHNAIVLGLLEARGIRRVVKSKSMLTEECGLNPHLEARGIEVVDTDLGERIVQLRREPPSHIVMPAIHLKRGEVGELFHRELGSAEGEDDPDVLTGVAREHLREVFLGAEAGITGVNFAIAETGEIVIVTNEGNADLGIALPQLHIASMGIDKVIPRRSDLGVFLRLLARSATGQAITAYTSHVRGPRPGGELHIVLVDDGRSRILAHGDRHRALRCIRCAACLNTCPVYRRSGGHSYGTSVAGPIGSILAPERDPDRHQSLPGACTLCGSCTHVCPVKIDLHHQLLAFRGSSPSGDESLRPSAGSRGSEATSCAPRRAVAGRGGWRACWCVGLRARSCGEIPGARRVIFRSRPRAAFAISTRAGNPVASSHGGQGSTRERMLAALRRAASLHPRVDRAADASFALELHPQRFPSSTARFGEMLVRAGGQVVEVASRAGLGRAIEALPNFGRGRVVSAIPELTRGEVLTSDADPHSVADVELAVVGARFGVAESGAVWIREEDAKPRALLFLAQHLVVVLDRSQIVHELHEAYDRLHSPLERGAGWGAFVCGPSKTADIEQALVIGAHGPRSMTVLLVGRG